MVKKLRAYRDKNGDTVMYDNTVLDKAMDTVRGEVEKGMSDMATMTSTIYGWGAKQDDNIDVKVENGDVTTVIELDGNELGRAVTPIVSREISKDRRRRR